MDLRDNRPVRLPDGVLVALPDAAAAEEWITGGGREMRLGGSTVRHNRSGLLEIVAAHGGVPPLIEFARLLAGLYRRQIMLVTRLPLARLDADLTGGGVPALLAAGLTVVAPCGSPAEVETIARHLPGAALVPYADGERVLFPVGTGPDQVYEPDAPTRRLPRPTALAEPGEPAPEQRIRDLLRRRAADEPRAALIRPYALEVSPSAATTVLPTPEPGPPVRRVLTATITNPDGTDAELKPEADYLLRIGVGGDPRVPRSPEGHRLDVVVTADGLAFEPAVREIFLPARGDGWTCACPWRTPAHVCAPDSRSSWLDLPLRTGVFGTDARLVVRVYTGGVLLQSVELRISGEGGAPETAVGYYRDPEFDDLDRHGGRALSCHLDGTDGRHLIVVNNGYGRPVRFELVDAQTARAASALREALYDTHLYPGAVQPRHRISLRGEPTKPAGEYLADLRQLAGLGARVYRALLTDPAAEDGLRAMLLETSVLTGQPALIQLARSAGTRLSLPWQLLYDEPLVNGPEAAQVCDSVWRWGPGGTGEPAPPRCPSPHTSGTGTICPFGFWGLAHILETAPTVRTRPLPVRTSAEPAPAQVIAGVDDSLHQWERHLARLGKITGEPSVTNSWQAFRAEAATAADLLYLYCHARFGPVDEIPPAVAYLDLGRGSSITADRLTAWSGLVRWSARRPLVFVNACSAGEPHPDLLSAFVDPFVNDLHAAGVVTTEIAVEPRAAQYAAETLLGGVRSGLPLGAAIRAMRWRLLTHGSLLGLAYTAQADALLTLP